MSRSADFFPTDKTAIITGAGTRRGIGRAVGKHLITCGWNVALVDIDEKAILTFADELAAESGRKTIGIGVDVANEGEVASAFKRIDAEMPPVIALINLAGIPSPDSFLELTPAMWDRVMDVNAKGAFMMTQAAALRMIRGGYGGRIVNTSSITALDGGGTFSKTGYAAAKAAVLGLTRGTARELGEFGITANVIVPGPIDTDIMGGRLTAERKTAMSANSPLRRVGQPEEIAGLISFLISEESGYITGATINIDGGKHMH